jgi:HPt (histidine-containing phosphotransfer) domain-containing protein
MSLASTQSRPVDLVHLARYTGGDAALNAEILQMFATQSADLVKQLASFLNEKDAKNWRHVTHTVKGAARGVGAFALADAAADAETVDPERDSTAAAGALRQIAAQAEAVKLFIDAYLGR